MKSTKVEIHAILYIDIDPDELTEADKEKMREDTAVRFRDEFDQVFSFGRALLSCENCSVGVEVT